MYMRDELMPELMAIDGCVGLSMLVDRDSGRCIATSAWQSLQTMRASDKEVRPLRDRYVEMFGASEPMIEEWDIAVMHRDHRSREGATARTSWLQGDPATVEDSIESFKMVLPSLERLPGFSSGSLLVNRESGRAVSTVTYDSPDALVQTREKAKELRARVAQDTSAEVLEVMEFELALAHLRVPEMV